MSIIPVGLKYEGNGKFVKPYVYLGFGMGAWVDSYVVVVENADKVRERDVWITPTINPGAGLKIKTGSKSVFFEVTPSPGLGVQGNLGFSF